MIMVATNLQSILALSFRIGTDPDDSEDLRLNKAMLVTAVSCSLPLVFFRAWLISCPVNPWRFPSRFFMGYFPYRHGLGDHFRPVIFLRRYPGILRMHRGSVHL